MRITRLHIVFALIGGVCLGIGLMRWVSLDTIKQALSSKPARPAPVRTPVKKTPASTGGPTAAQTVATVGAAYQPLRKQFGDIPTISQPLREAKQQLAQGQQDKALAAARQAWQAVKAYRQKMDKAANTYQIVRGDTLWKIAAAYSPAEAGAGWVTIWKANKDLVRDFNRIEVGWTLAIPPQKTQYVMPFWKPK